MRGLTIHKIEEDLVNKVYLIFFHINEPGLWWYDYAASGYSFLTKSWWGALTPKQDHPKHTPLPIKGLSNACFVWDISKINKLLTPGRLLGIETQVAMWKYHDNKERRVLPKKEKTLPNRKRTLHPGWPGSPPPWIPLPPNFGWPGTGEPSGKTRESIPGGGGRPSQPTWSGAPLGPVTPNYGNRPGSLYGPSTSLKGQGPTFGPTTPSKGTTTSKGQGPIQGPGAPVKGPVTRDPEKGSKGAIINPDPFGTKPAVPTKRFDPARGNSPGYTVSPVDPTWKKVSPKNKPFERTTKDPYYNRGVLGAEKTKRGTSTNYLSVEEGREELTIWSSMEFSKYGVSTLDLGSFSLAGARDGNYTTKLSAKPTVVRHGDRVSIGGYMSGTTSDPITCDVGLLMFPDNGDPVLVDEWSGLYSGTGYTGEPARELYFCGDYNSLFIDASGATLAAVVLNRENKETLSVGTTRVSVQKADTDPYTQHDPLSSGPIVSNQSQIALGSILTGEVYQAPLTSTGCINLIMSCTGDLSVAVAPSADKIEDANITLKLVRHSAVSGSGIVPSWSGTTEYETNNPLLENNVYILTEQHYAGINNFTGSSTYNLFVETDHENAQLVDVYTAGATILSGTAGTLDTNTVTGTVELGNSKVYGFRTDYKKEADLGINAAGTPVWDTAYTDASGYFSLRLSGTSSRDKFIITSTTRHDTPNLQNILVSGSL